MSAARFTSNLVLPAIVALVSALLGGCASGPGGIVRGEQVGASLAPCPARPSCVVSSSNDSRHAIEPLQFNGTAEAAITRLSEILKAMPRTRIEVAEGQYLHAIKVSRWLHYTDDIEFLVGADGSQIEVRSCSRVGYYDFGVNRDRVEVIRAQLK